MSDHTPKMPTDENHKLPNQPFFSWLKTQSTLFVSQLLGIISFISFLAALFYYIKKGESWKHFDPKRIQAFIHYFHIFFITIFILVLISILNKNHNASYRVGLVYRKIFNDTLTPEKLKRLLRNSKIQLRKFKCHFLLFWTAMLILYTAFALKLIFEKKRKKSDEIFSYSWDAFWHLKFEFITFALNNLSLLFIFWCFVVLSLPSHNTVSRNKQKLLLNYSSIAVLLVTLAFPLMLNSVKNDLIFTGSNLTAYATAFNAISGTLFALVLALLIARLDSKLIGLPSWLISVLYFYSAVQPLFVAFGQDTPVFDIIETSALIIAFIFKIYFFFIIVYTMQTGRMLNYLFCFPTLNRHVDSIFGNQFEICMFKEHKDYSFVIQRDNHKIYSTNIYHDTDIKCREEIELVRELMKNSSSYSHKTLSGIHWIEVINKEKK